MHKIDGNWGYYLYEYGTLFGYTSFIRSTGSFERVAPLVTVIFFIDFSFRLWLVIYEIVGADYITLYIIRNIGKGLVCM